MDEEKYLITGLIEIKLNNGTAIKVYADGYSYNDIVNNDESKIKPNFNDPVELIKYLQKKDEILSNLRSNYIAEDTLFSAFDNIQSDTITEVKEIIKNNITHKSNLANNGIEIYEPPLEFEQIWGDQKPKKKIRVSDAKGIRIPYSVKDAESIFSSFCIRFMENASYYVFIEDGQNRKFDVRLFGKIEKGYITPYRGAKNGWIINFGNQLFYGNIEIVEINEGKEIENSLIKIPLLVYPKKLEPKEAEKIVEEILNFHAELIYDLEPTGLTIIPGEYAKKTPIQRLKYIRHLFEKRKLKKILNSILENPDKKLVKEEILKEIQDIETPVAHLLPELVIEGSAIRKVNFDYAHFINNGQGYQFTKAYEEVSRVTHDTYPNRFVKFFLKILKLELTNIETELYALIEKDENSQYKKYYKWLMDEIEPPLKDMKRDVNRVLNRDFFREVSDLRFFSSPPQTLLKEYRYQQIFSAYLDLIKGVLLFDRLDELLQDPIKNMPELYEYWCFLKLWKILKEHKEFNAITPYVSYRKEKGTETFVYGVSVRFSGQNLSAELIYNKYFGKSKSDYSYSVPLRPDFSLTIKNNDKNDNNKQLILFDAKYRVDWIEEVAKLIDQKDKDIEDIVQQERRGTFKLGDIYKMHTYREAIRQEPKEKKQPLWVIALYPGTDKKGILYREDKVKQEKDINEFLLWGKNNINIGGIGAIPLRPSK